MHKARQPPPPPSPQCTPPKDDLSALVDECSQLASKFSEELKDLREFNGVPSVPSVPGVPLEDPSTIQLHPLRILSEENLTVISSFAGGSAGDLRGEGDHEDVDPSTLSFFEVS